MRKRRFYTETAYLLGIFILALGTAWMERGDFGMSMVVAPAYILHCKISQFLPIFSFGMAEYALQILLILALSIVIGRFKFAYAFSIVTAIVYGFMLDLCIWLTALLPVGNSMVWRILFYFVGMAVCSVGVSLLFHTYLAPGAYELVVKEISAEKNIEINKFKTAYDCVSCLVAIALSFLFFGFWHFEGISFGTIICALVNGWLISKVSRFLERTFEFRDGLPLRQYFIR